MKRAFDLVGAGLGLALLGLPMLLIALLVRLTSRGPALHWSRRVGRGNRLFWMPKFRTMKTGAPQVATHLMARPGQFLTPLGRFLRAMSLDELPQLYNVLKGNMSLVGPRPALFNQDDLIALRASKGIHRLVPGITGWAQINGRDELPIPAKVEFEEFYLRRRSFLFDIKILLLTALKVIRREGVSH